MLEFILGFLAWGALVNVTVHFFKKGWHSRDNIAEKDKN